MLFVYGLLLGVGAVSLLWLFSSDSTDTAKQRLELSKADKDDADDEILEERFRKHSKWFRWAAGFWLFFFYVIALIAQVGFFKMDKVGQFGDAFNILNALFAGLAFAGIIATLRLQLKSIAIQQEELRETRKEFRGSREAQEATAQSMAMTIRISALQTLIDATEEDINQCREGMISIGKAYRDNSVHQARRNNARDYDSTNELAIWIESMTNPSATVSSIQMNLDMYDGSLILDSRKRIREFTDSSEKALFIKIYTSWAEIIADLTNMGEEITKKSRERDKYVEQLRAIMEQMAQASSEVISDNSQSDQKVLAPPTPPQD